MLHGFRRHAQGRWQWRVRGAEPCALNTMPLNPSSRCTAVNLRVHAPPDGMKGIFREQRAELAVG